MMMQGITILLAALASLGLAAPHTGEFSFGNLTLNKREDMAASCLKHLCCKNSKRNLEMATDHQADAEAQCLICWKFGICGKRTDAVPEDNPGKVTVEISPNIPNPENGGFWIKRDGREYWVDRSGKYWEWMGGDDDRNRGHRGDFRRGGKGHVSKGRGGRLVYTFDD
ncbi:hypothetical protein GQ602_003719 [Ophiocordyceps camponoti-floridani]|uniref:Cyanovirin-N domain-containing protein n=1 Tax=Ophiocordyceps camponoti-floridani TaxID=2030778 RepID=A0A8H4VEJ8_9HYPO|nr:hypothetical protein GQ602_003719 [Ophiocordyceps camponoti-floridani]